jgi:hypothetical protein
MKTKTLLSQKHQNIITTVNTLRENAGEMLRVADHLEATQRFIGNGSANVIRSPGSPPRRMSLVTKRKIAKANRARAAQKKLAVVGKAA